VTDPQAIECAKQVAAYADRLDWNDTNHTKRIIPYTRIGVSQSDFCRAIYDLGYNATIEKVDKGMDLTEGGKVDCYYLLKLSRRSSRKPSEAQ
jgi:hypothetical protein